ncbi:hypothetical protein [Magnetospirillum molischianum]|uniref:Uncharacterized protein n=1 Tax=Magnetospirillum molischianum DSM 120 TaxID=1150626 RepID=H8FY04_MAGML|nr:hypothetical protein [Magnetospirillum molischianum]CCG43242.1 hypothetical protein PHAMO_80033 [Magnetospirillum molischianum DSM 120]
MSAVMGGKTKGASPAGVRKVLGLIESGVKIGIFGLEIQDVGDAKLLAQLNAALARAELDGLVDTEGPEGKEIMTITARGREWMAEHDRSHVNGIEHSVIGELLYRLDGELATKIAPILNASERKALNTARRMRWIIVTSHDRYMVTNMGEDWLLQTLQEDTLNKIAVGRALRLDTGAESQRRAINPLWGSW